jgi:muconolactone delta-isomerase
MARVSIESSPPDQGGDQVEFLVRIEIQLDESLSVEQRKALYAAEAERARALAEAGHLVRLWRLPGRRANWGLWRAADATELHEVLTSLPLWPYMDVDVNPLARHPNDPLGAD